MMNVGNEMNDEMLETVNGGFELDFDWDDDPEEEKKKKCPYGGTTGSF